MTMSYHIQLQFSIKVLKLKFIMAYLRIILDYASFHLYEPFPTNLAAKFFCYMQLKSKTKALVQDEEIRDKGNASNGSLERKLRKQTGECYMQDFYIHTP